MTSAGPRQYATYMRRAADSLHRSALVALVVAGAACNEPIASFGPGEPTLRNPQIAAIGGSSGFPDGYLGIYAEPSDPALRFAAGDRVEMMVVSPTGDSVALELGRRYCEVGSNHYSVCHEYVLTLDTAVAFDELQRRLADVGYGLNPIGGVQFAAAFDFYRRPMTTAELSSIAGIRSAGYNSIASLALPPQNLAGRGLHGAVVITRTATAPGDQRLTVPDTGSVTVRYRQPDGTVLSQTVSITPLY